MTENIAPDDFIDALLPVVGQCARASLIFYGQVADIGKAADKSLTGSKAQDASTAFTVLDAAVQDILLAVVLQHFPFVRCIAEERTPLKKRFAGNALRPTRSSSIPLTAPCTSSGATLPITSP